MKRQADIIFCRILIILISLTTLNSCQKDTVYFHYQSLSEKGWEKTDTLTFSLPPELTGHSYKMQIGLRHTGIYPYRDIWMEMRQPFSKETVPDTLHIQLADSLGNWYGKGTAGHHIQYLSAEKTVRLNPADSCLQLILIMNDNPLKGIADVGIRLMVSGSIDAEKNK